jgi:general secretion pathway protein B
MSYILDALRKADAERERGHVPGIHAQPMFAGAPGTAAPRAARPWKWIAAALLALLVGVLLWSLLRGRGEPAGTPSLATPAAPAAVAMAPAPVAVPQRSWAEPTQSAPATAATQSVKPAPPPSAAPLPAPAPKPVAVKPVVSPKVDAKAAASGAAAVGAAASAPGAAGEARIYALKELPDEVRRQLPALAIGGSMYSNTPADRILIINGQVLHEGDRITPDLQLQQIKLKAAVLAFKGYRYTITF